VGQNIAFRLVVGGAAMFRINVRKGRRFASTQSAMDRKPAELSGGSVSASPSFALVRELRSSCSTNALEPDAMLRVRCGLLATQGAGATMIYVTHDQICAMTLADRLSFSTTAQIGSCWNSMRSSPTVVPLSWFAGYGSSA
jgi:ABC-type sugar transport system ATPase subunit